MDAFLSSIRPRLDAEPNANVILVTGNESADLDSIISAITTSFFLSRLANNKTSIVIPYVNIPKIDLALRSDVEYILSANNINKDLLFFRDQQSIFENLASKNQLSLFLVDHNKVALSMASLKSAKVVGIIDHHADENLYKDTANPRRIEVVGSCTTLVADEYLKSAIDNDKSDSAWIPQLARLMLAPILIDTMDLNPDMKKVQPLDISMANLIYPHTGLDSMQNLHQNIDKARQDTSKLSCYDLLRKDYKEWTITQYTTGKDIKIGISSVIGLMVQYVKRDGKEALLQAIDKWVQHQAVDLSFVMFMGEDHGEFQRQLLVNPVSSSVKDISDQLEKIPLLELERTSIVDTDEFVKKGGRAYLQHNSACSRKQAWPTIEKMLTQPPQTSDL
ncbi:Exopolyphosphatase [Entomortierella lignicola]|nr:Exopolyphosphatase [Entomortierella lignicola]